MSPERWQQIEDVFQAVVDLAPEERLVYLERNHADDPDLIDEIKRLISDYDEAGDFIESPVWTDSFMLGATARDQIGGALDKEINRDKTSMIGRRLGVYLLTKELGRGGMGAVYLAERADGEFRQRVALKVIKRGMDTDFIVRRFRNERQILATLDHPNIARLLDGGTTDDGLPFFVMEYIEGAPVYRYSDARRLSINERLRLFARICYAVDYAHENLIIHRDIKPTNILVTGEGVPKLLDFGIAKILNPELAADSIDPTATAMRMMTPEYASPEQVRGEAVTKTSDIYSLGVLLYELLTGHRPYRLKNRALHEIARVICEEEPENLGASLTRDDNFVPTSTNDEKTTLEAIFESRRGDRESLRRELSGDLERVVFKALRKDPNERYQSAAELAEDIARYLDGTPVLAPALNPSRPFFAPPVNKTNPDEISVAVLPLKIFGTSPNDDTGDDYLCVGLADALITRLSNVRRFIVRPTSSVLKYGGGDTEPITAGEELGVNYLIDGNIRRVGSRLRVTVQLLNIQEGAARWAEKFDEDFTDVLSLEDLISEKVAEALLPQLTGDERDRLKKRGTDNPQAFEHYLRGRHYWNSFTEDGFAKAIIAYYQAIAHDPKYALAYAGIADYHNWLGVYGVLPSKECFQSAIENARQAIALDGSLGEAYASLAFAQHGGNFEWEESERNFQTALRFNPNVAETHVWYSIKLTTEGRFDEGIRHAERAVELDPLTPFNQHNLGWILYYARQFERSLRQYRKAAELFPAYPLAHYGLAWVLRHLGRFDEAVAAANRARELMRESAFSLHVQGQTFAAAGMREQAAVILEKLDRLAEKQFVSPYHTALIHAYLDDREKALRYLESCREKSEAWLVWLGVEPAFDGLRTDPRFKAVLAQTRNPLIRHAEAAAEKSDPTLAVLPFKVMNPDGAQHTDDKFLGVGLADALITRLSNVRKFTVRPTSSVLRYDTENDPFTAGRELGVDFLIDGSIRRLGEKLRVTVQLLTIEDGATRWAQRFDEDVTDFLTLEDSISEQIAGELLPQLTGDERDQLRKRGTNDPRAYEAYLRGRYFWNKFTNESFPKAFEAFSEAVQIDPNFAQAHVGIADFYVWLCIFGVLPSLEAFPQAKAAAQRALELDPKLGEAYTTLGFVTTIHDWDWNRAEELFKRALELSPNYSNAHEWYSNLLAAVGRHDEAVAASTRSVELNPLSGRASVMHAWLLYQTRHFRRSVREAEKSIELERDFSQGLLHLGNALDKAGRSEEAITALRESIRLWQDSALPRNMLCHALVNAGRETEARAVLAEILEENERQPVKPYFVAVAYAAFENERDAVFEWLEKAFAERNEWLIWLGTEPKFDALRDDPRYFALLERMNNPLARQQRSDSTAVIAASSTTIAVLPLKTFQTGRAANTEEEFLGIGLADALITRLSSVKRLVVRPTNSVVRFGKTTTDPFELARELDAQFIVDGHVKRAGERIRVSVQLLNAAEKTAVWAQSFDENYTDVLTLEDTISEQIAAALLPQLTEDEKQKLGRRPTDDAKAFEAYIRGRYHWNSFTEEGLQKSLLCYREALEYDASFALAYAGIADYYNFICIFGSKSPILSFPAAREAAQKAIELDPHLAEGYVALGVATFGYDWDFAEGERLLKKALELNPNYAVGHFWYAQILSLKGDHDGALRAMRRAEQLSPGIPSLLVIYAFTYRNARRFEKSLEKIRQALAIQPNYYVAVQGFGWVVKWTKNYDEAEEICRKSVEQTKRFSLPLYAYAYVLAARGKDAEARKIVAELEERRLKQYLPAAYLSLIYLELGDTDAAFAWLEKSFEEREFWAIWLPIDPRYDELKKDPRYNDLINRLGPAGESEDIHQSHIATRIFPAFEPEPPPAAEPAAAEPPVEEPPPAKKSRRRLLVYAAAAVILCGVLAMFALSRVTRRLDGGYQITFSTENIKTPAVPNPSNQKTIAVMPFTTDADFENEESYATGLSESIYQKLSQVSGMSARSIFLKLKKEPTLDELAQNYGVNYVLRGQLHVEDDRARIRAELVNTADGKVLWLENFDENLNNFQALQTSISERVLKALTIELSASERREIAKNLTENSEAYRLYLVGRYQLTNRSAASLNKAIKTFEKAKTLDPKFALAYTGAADAYALLNLYQVPPPPDAYAKAKENAQKAVELDPNLAEAHASLGYVLFYKDHNHEEAVKELGRAIELNPAYSTAYHWLSLMLSAMNRHDDAVRNIRKAIDLEPRSAIIQTAAGLVYFYARRYDEALATAEKVLDSNEGFIPAYKTKRVVFEAMGNYSAALTAYQNERIYSENTDENDEGWLMIAAQLQAVGGSRDEALASLKRATENSFVRANPQGFAHEIAIAYALLGETDAALEWLKKSKDANAYGFNFAATDPRFDKIRSDPRFAELVGGAPSP
ncbi:MAG: tetratricopeptide repeat protein [Acidobacteria bacterium]|nr:tetratricopeptide repeat protein [Acidobacteriota bacterium]